MFAELNDTALYGSQRPLTLFAELNDTALYGSQCPLTLFAELNDTALYGSQCQVLGHVVRYFLRSFLNYSGLHSEIPVNCLKTGICPESMTPYLWDSRSNIY
ncbi:hypothetical protein BWD12_01615 [Leptospira santarosai serovar Bananal]|nr:Uncharacterized protein XB15_01975 [Leptospira santarosai]OLY63012.1 hypothetical protein BWD11_16680 [Leptospira santarosai serovar Grippotyphosa]ONF81617.1 hypothetical protein BWD12_01615 [Leptospira santarosai serovar Bananal]ONF86295.1 hypothetical protein BWD13_10960 [Leptospira santarosai serovar Grippotyphosa]